MTEAWKQWEGQVIAGVFPLRKFLGGDEEHGVFLTEYSANGPRPAAIKIIAGDTESTEAQLQRWSVAAKLSHRHLIEIFSAGRGQVGETPLVYVAMEHADEDLGQVIPGRALTSEEARQMIGPALDALSYIHGQGFVHGHLNPGQIKAVGDRVKIACVDACRPGESAAASADRYRPPEQEISAAGDVWSLGMILVEALTARLPEDGVDGADPVLPEGLPQPFDEIARRALRADPNRRARPGELSLLLQPGKPRTVRRADAVAVLIGLAVAAIAITPRLLNRPAAAPTKEPVQVRTPAPVQPPAAEPVPVPARPSQPAPPAPPPNEPEPRDEIVARALPEVPAQASRTIRGRVRVGVRVRVDPSGRVGDARLESAGPSRYFAELALGAARRWKFAPASGEREWILRFEFSRAGTRVVPARIGR